MTTTPFSKGGSAHKLEHYSSRSARRAVSWLLLGERPSRAPVTLLITPRETMHLRSFHDDDWAAICEIYDLGKPDEMRGVLDPQSLLPLVADEAMTGLFRVSQIVVAEEALRVVGFAGHRGSFITWLFVHPEFRRRGIANALVRHLIARLERPITLNVVSGNTAARALYAQLGFKVERELRGNFQGWPCHICKLSYETVA